MPLDEREETGLRERERISDFNVGENGGRREVIKVDSKKERGRFVNLKEEERIKERKGKGFVRLGKTKDSVKRRSVFCWRK